MTPDSKISADLSKIKTESGEPISMTWFPTVNPDGGIPELATFLGGKISPFQLIVPEIDTPFGISTLTFGTSWFSSESVSDPVTSVVVFSVVNACPPTTKTVGVVASVGTINFVLSLKTKVDASSVTIPFVIVLNILSALVESIVGISVNSVVSPTSVKYGKNITDEATTPPIPSRLLGWFVPVASPNQLFLASIVLASRVKYQFGRDCYLWICY